MKKFWYFLFCYIILLMQPMGCKSAFALSQNTTYAKVSSGCVLYKNQDMNNSFENIYFVIPETYFVSVVEVVSEKCFKVQYGNYIGYVDSSNLVIATFIPRVKQLEDVTCDVKETSGTQVWSCPTSTSRVLTTIPAGAKNINYIAFVYGEIPRGGESNLWYYVSYTPTTSSTSVYEGYVYSENITNLSEIPVNIENNPETENAENEAESTIVISSSIRTLLVALIAIPIILFLAIILYKIVKKFRENTNKGDNLQLEHNENFAENNQNFISARHIGNLKNQISNLKNSTFVKKQKSDSERREYPVFPSYDSDDDLL